MDPHPKNEVLVDSAARTASGDSGELDGWAVYKTLRVQLNVTAASGTTPNLAVYVEDTIDGTNWNTIGTFTAKTAAGIEAINITNPFTDRLRVRWAISGTTPSFTFDVHTYAE